MIGQITKTLSRNAWSQVVIEENGEELLEMQENPRLQTGLIAKDYQPLFYVRKTVAEKLNQVATTLPKKFNLVLIEGYRTLKSQQESWDRKFAKLREENPEWTDEEIESKVRLVVARPNPLANHHCGGAVDVTLSYSDGTLVDMGTPYPSEAMGTKWYKKFPMLSDEITAEQKSNRQILREAMETQSFVWYPGEWWHYCYGDRMWAVYSNQTKCFYGPIER